MQQFDCFHIESHANEHSNILQTGDDYQTWLGNQFEIGRIFVHKYRTRADGKWNATKQNVISTNWLEKPIGRFSWMHWMDSNPTHWDLIVFHHFQLLHWVDFQHSFWWNKICNNNTILFFKFQFGLECKWLKWTGTNVLRTWVSPPYKQKYWACIELIRVSFVRF